MGKRAAPPPSLAERKPPRRVLAALLAHAHEKCSAGVDAILSTGIMRQPAPRHEVA